MELNRFRLVTVDGENLTLFVAFEPYKSVEEFRFPFELDFIAFKVFARVFFGTGEKIAQRPHGARLTGSVGTFDP